MLWEAGAKKCCKVALLHWKEKNAEGLIVIAVVAIIVVAVVGGAEGGGGAGGWKERGG